MTITKGKKEPDRFAPTVVNVPERKLQRREAKRAALEWSTAELAQLHWYLLMARRGSEFDVEALLEGQGHVAVVPIRTAWRRVNRYAKRKTEKTFMLLPGYVFVGFDAAGRDDFMPPWHRLFAISMVQSVIGFDDDGPPRRLRGRLVAEFLKDHRIHKAADDEQHMRTHREFKAGEMVDVVEGAYEGQQRVRVTAIRGHVAQVVMPLFGSEHDVPIPLAFLERSE